MNQNKATEFAESIPKANVVVGDNSDQNLLRTEELNNFDAVVCLTDIF